MAVFLKVHAKFLVLIALLGFGISAARAQWMNVDVQGIHPGHRNQTTLHITYQGDYQQDVYVEGRNVNISGTGWWTIAYSYQFAYGPVWTQDQNCDATGDWEVRLRVVNPDGSESIAASWGPYYIDEELPMPSVNSQTQNVNINTSVSFTMTGTNCDTFTSSNLPAGLSIASNGTVSGIPTVEGNYVVTVYGHNVNGDGSGTLTINVIDNRIAQPTPSISTPTQSIPYGTAIALSATGGAGTGAYAYSVQTGYGIVSGNMLTAAWKSGSVVVQVYRAGDATYKPSALSAGVSFTMVDNGAGAYGTGCYYSSSNVDLDSIFEPRIATDPMISGTNATFQNVDLRWRFAPAAAAMPGTQPAATSVKANNVDFSTIFCAKGKRWPFMITGIAINSGQWYVNYISTTRDGITWSTPVQYAPGYQSPGQLLVYGNQRYVILQTTWTPTSTAWYSNNAGTSWSSVATPINESWTAAVYGGGKFVAVNAGANGAANTVLYSSDGISWNSNNGGGLSSQTHNSIAYGMSMYLVGSNNSYIEKSSDGVNWSQQYVAPSGNTANWTGIAYGNGMFVATGDYWNGGWHTARMLKSTDGTNWTLTANIGASNDGNGFPPNLFFCNGIFISSNTNGSNVIWTSTDGATWTKVTLPTYSYGRWSFAYGNGIWIGFQVGGSVVTSNDGSTWTARSLGYSTSNSGMLIGP